MRELLSLLREAPGGETPVDLTWAGRARVKFSGERGGEGPVTKGQASILRWASDTSQYNRMVQWTFELTAGTSLADITAALGVLMARHESLRTAYPPAPGGGERIQRVAPTGELPIEIYEAGPQPGIPVIAERLIALLRAEEFDLAGGLPLRVAVAVCGGAPRTAVAVYSHVAADLVSMAVIGGQFTQLAGDPASREAGPRGHQPLDQAAAERSPRGRRRADAAQRIWEKHLRTMPQCLYAMPRPAQVTRPGEGGALAGWLWSRAAALALPQIAARTGVTRPVTVLAALCALLARRTGQDRCVLAAMASNRPEGRLLDYVGTMTGDSIVSVDTCVQGFDELARRAQAATLVAGRSAMYDGATLTPAIGAIEHERGIAFARECVFNDVTGADSAPTAASTAGDPAGVMGALEHSELRWIESAGFGDTLLTFLLMYVEGEMMLGGLTGDASRVPRRELESLLRGTELLLAHAAAGDVDLARLGEITGVEPAVRDQGWLRIDSCWVELAEVQRLADDALLPPARVFAISGPAGEPVLVAYLAAGEGIATPEDAHAACMALVPSPRSGRGEGQVRYTAMAPGQYVICDGAPDDPSGLRAWQRRPVLARGTGRRSDSALSNSGLPAVQGRPTAG
jgi:hypothetical protein